MLEKSKPPKHATPLKTTRRGINESSRVHHPSHDKKTRISHRIVLCRDSSCARVGIVSDSLLLAA